MKHDYLIVGQGVAGSILAWFLIEKGKRVLIVDPDHDQSSSIIAAGILNPVTGKRFAITDEYSQYYEFAKLQYAILEEKFDEKFLEHLPILRMFQDESERDHCLRKDEQQFLDQYKEAIYKANHFDPQLNDGLGSIMLKQSGFCYTSKLLKTLQKYFKDLDMLVNDRIAYDDISIGDNEISYKGDQFACAIFCEGYQAQFNPWFDWLDYNSVKGEILEVEIENKNLPNAVINKGKWAVPIEENKWMAGATYIWDDLDCEPSEQGKEEILLGLNQSINKDVKVLGQRAAVRPVMKDQVPVIGMHPEISNMGILNGLGSKGFLVAPYWASLFADYLAEGKALPESVGMKRFMTRRSDGQ